MSDHDNILDGLEPIPAVRVGDEVIIDLGVEHRWGGRFLAVDELSLAFYADADAVGRDSAAIVAAMRDDAANDPQGLDTDEVARFEAQMATIATWIERRCDDG